MKGIALAAKGFTAYVLKRQQFVVQRMLRYGFNEEKEKLDRKSMEDIGFALHVALHNWDASDPIFEWSLRKSRTVGVLRFVLVEFNKRYAVGVLRGDVALFAQYYDLLKEAEATYENDALALC